MGQGRTDADARRAGLVETALDRVRSSSLRSLRLCVKFLFSRKDAKIAKGKAGSVGLKPRARLKSCPDTVIDE
jgi:hypothetical protein